MSDEWRLRAACRHYPYPRIFFPTDNDPGIEAKAVCAACPVQKDCLLTATRNGERHGIWGGELFHRRTRRRVKRCEVCGNEFAGRGNQRYDSEACAELAERLARSVINHRYYLNQKGA